MSTTTTVHRAYNDVVASHYDLDPQGVIGRSLDRRSGTCRMQTCLGRASRRLPFSISAWGRGYFWVSSWTWPAIRSSRSGSISPRTWWRTPQKDPGPDRRGGRCDRSSTTTSRGSNSTAFARISSRATCRCSVLAPKIASRLKPGGYWSLVGGTKAAYPALQAKGDSQVLRWLSGIGSRKMDDTVLNPANLEEVADTMNAHGFEVAAGETFKPGSRIQGL